MPQPILRTARLLLVPLADRHLELEIQLDSDPDVLRYISGRPRSRDEVRRYWRQGLASEASRALPRHAFDAVGQSRVIAQTMAVNAGSRGVMEAIGMRYVRTYFRPWDDPLPGADLGEVEYEMTRERWETRSTE
jgi:RimJ/RimL family protein N-acetyltransferase